MKVRLAQDKVCLLVVIGVRGDGRKELVASADGFRESTESWADLLRDCKRRGMRASVLAVGDGALGFGAALGDVFPGDPRATMLVPCPGRRSRRAAEVRAPRREQAAGADLQRRRRRARLRRRQGVRRGLRRQVAEGGREGHRSSDVLLESYRYPAEHWIHLRTTDENVNGVADNSRSLVLSWLPAVAA